jgi:hypothetical protein
MTTTKLWLLEARQGLVGVFPVLAGLLTARSVSEATQMRIEVLPIERMIWRTRQMARMRTMLMI